MKKFCSIVLAALMSSGVATAVTRSGSCGDNAVWTLDGNTLRISGTGATTDHGSPNSIYATYPDWYDCKDDIHAVVVESGITSLGSFSFYEYKNLESVTLPEGLTRIGNGAFYKCVSLSDVKFPSSLETIGDKLLNYNNNGYVFCGCQSLRSITLPENLKVISGGSFNDCKNLTQVNWNAVGCDADVMDPVARYVGIFAGSSVVGVAFGKEVKSIPAKAFFNVKGLSRVSTQGGVCFVGYAAFGGTDWQNEVAEPGKVLYIDSAAYFFDLHNEDAVDVSPYAVEIKPGTKCITDHLFENSKYLARVTIPESVEKIGIQAFSNCKALKTVDWKAVAIAADDADYKAAGIFSSSRQVNLMQVNFGSNVAALPDKLLYHCELLPDVKLPESLRSIGAEAFAGCNSLTSLTIPDGVERLGRLAISDCNNLEKLTIGEGLKEFDYYYFLAGCPKLGTLEWNAVHTVEKTHDMNHASDVCSGPIEHFIVGDKVEYVPGQLFWNSKTLTDVAFGKSIKVIGEAAFRACPLLSSVKLPASLEKIGAYAFCDNSFESVIIPANVTELGVWAFGSSRKLTTVICCPLPAPSNTSSFVSHSDNVRFYVTDATSYSSDGWSQYKPWVESMLAASVSELTDENSTPSFSVNIPEYDMTSMDAFTADKTPGEHYADLNASFAGPQGDFDAIIRYHYTYAGDSSIGSVSAESAQSVIVYDMRGVKVYEGASDEMKSGLPSGLYIVRTPAGTSKIRIN